MAIKPHLHLCLTGGHLTPALALGGFCLSQGDRVSFIGREFTGDQKTILSRESSELSHLGGNFYPLPVPQSPYRLPQWGLSFIKAISLLKVIQPDVVVGFGSYVSVPVGLAAATLHLPLIIHEQTTVPGLANRLLAHFARKIFVGFPQAINFFSPSKAIFIGNILRPEFTALGAPPAWLPQVSLPLIYITGGNQGSETLNQLVSLCVPELLTRYLVVLQCGGYGTDRAQKLTNQLNRLLGNALSSRLIVKDWLSSKAAAYVFKQAHLVIGRAGANTVSEIIYCQCPSLLIPLPKSRFAEQANNASLIASSNAGLVVSQKDLTPTKLISALKHLETNYVSYKHQLQALSATMPPPTPASFYHLIKTSLK